MRAVNHVLDRLERDPFDPKLGTTIFQSDELGGIDATPLREGSWYVFWQANAEAKEIEIVLIHELDIA